jgi:hypothetical protein
VVDALHPERAVAAADLAELYALRPAPPPADLAAHAAALAAAMPVDDRAWSDSTHARTV